MSKLDDVLADVADYHAKVVAKVDELKAQIAALQGQGGVSDADLQKVIDAVDAAKGELTPPVAPVPAPAPDPVPAPVDPVDPTAS